MPVNLIRNADVHAISIVGKGANRKRFFLFKSEPEEKADHIATGRLLKEDGQWNAAYVVVAEPGWHESPGSAPGTDRTIEDRWASETEILKAAHRFMKNGALVNRMHEDLEPFGTVVENYIAPADFQVNGETIRKGSWVIAIAPTEEGREAIDKGEFGGVSIEGAAVRELVEKAMAEGSTPDPRTVGAVEGKEEAALLADAIAKRLVPQQPAAPAPTAAPAVALDAGAIADAVREAVAELLASKASTAGPGWDEGIHHVLSDIFGPTPAENATSIESLSKCDDETLSAAIAELVPESPGPEAILKAYEAEGISPELVGIFG